MVKVQMFQMNNQKEVREDGFLSGTWLANHVLTRNYCRFENLGSAVWMNEWSHKREPVDFSLWTWECGFKSFLKVSLFRLVTVWDRDVNLPHHCPEDDPVNLRQGVKMIQKTNSGPGLLACLGDQVELGLLEKELWGITSVKCHLQELVHGWVGDQFCS